MVAWGSLGAEAILEPMSWWNPELKAKEYQWMAVIN